MTTDTGTFDLATEAWINCRYLDGTVQEIGLRRLVTEADQIADIAPPFPIAYGALYRIAAAITYRVTGLDRLRKGESAESWYRRRNNAFGTPFEQHRVERYFATNAHRLQLYDRRHPFLQDPRLAQECPHPSGIGKLVVGRPAGNARPWLSGSAHDDEQPPLPSPEAALQLVMWTYYGCGGTLSPRVHGTVRANAGCMAAVLRGTVGYHPLGPDLHTTLLAHLTLPDGPEANPDLARWETRDLPDPTRPPPVSAGPVSLLANRGRHAMLLLPSRDGRSTTDFFLTWGARNDPNRRPEKPGEHVEPFPDPFLSYRRSANGSPSSPVEGAGSRHLFRDLDVLLNDPAGDAPPTPHTRPLVLAACDHLPDDVAEHLRLRVVGAEQDRAKTYDHQWWTDTTPPLLAHTARRDPQTAERICSAVKEADTAGRNLKRALATAFGDHNEGQAHTDRLAQPFWPLADRIFWDLYTTGQLDDAQPRLRSAALDVFDQGTAGLARSPGAGERAARGRARLPLPRRKATA